MIIKPAYYNENDKVAAQWLRNLIAQGHIAPGDVDERSIEDVQPDDLKSYAQCHFFAGIGVWSYALRRAGWPDSKQVWTGSCPCQPFSAAGKGTGFDDERHLWPAWLYLIDECRPPVILGEQVASKNAEPWIDLVHADMEVLDYAFGCVPFPSASVGAPHIRDRLYWVGHAIGAGLEGHAGHGDREPGRQKPTGSVAASGDAGGLAHAEGQRFDWGRTGRACNGRDAARQQSERLCDVGGMADHLMQQRPNGEPGICLVDDAGGRLESSAAATGLCGDMRHSPTDGFWADADWLYCRDGKWRPVEPGTFPLARRASARVGRLRAYGNAINAKAAQVFIEVVMDSMGYGDL